MIKSVTLLILGVITFSRSYTQLLSTIPAFPQDTSAFAITVDCSFGNRALFNYGTPSDVYVHVGVITNLSNGASDWKYVKFPNFNIPYVEAQATALSGNRYQYIITNPRVFFGVPPGETILKIAILFRNGNGSVVQRNSDGSDMYIPIYGAGFTGKYIQPYFQPRYIPIPEPLNKNIGDTVKIFYRTTSTADNIKLYFNGVLLQNVLASNIVLDSPVVLVAGNQQIVANVTKGATVFSDTFNFFVASSTNIAPLPPGVTDGINYEAGDTSVVLVLYAPGKGRASVVGEFNNWVETSSSQMNLTPDSLRFWIRIGGLTPGAEVAYQYLINGSLKIADPYTEKVLDPDNDPAIGATLYPNLKTYPTGKTTGIVSVLQTAKPAYTWGPGTFTRPDKRNLLIYEVLLRDFILNHDWKTLRDTLGYFKKLGINAIELMPINEFEGNNSWGYNPSFYFAPDKYYGPENDLKAFIDACHQDSIAVIMDIALNHSFGQSPLVQLYWDAVNNRPAPNNPWFNPVAKHAFNVGYDMNHESAATKYFVSRVVAHWLQNYRIDGFRFDLSKGFTQNTTCDANGNNCDVTSWSNYDASRVAIWKRYYDTLQLKSPGSYVILEHFAANTEEKELSDYGMMLWGNGNASFNEATMGYLGGSNFDGVLHTVRGWNQPALVGYMESHDEERLMFKNLAFGNMAGIYNVKDLNTALRRNEMAAAFFLNTPGPKMIWEFGEMGYDLSINHCTNGSDNPSCRLDPKPIRWDYAQVFYRKRLIEENAALLHLRAHPFFHDLYISNNVAQDLSGAVKWMKLSTDTSNVVVVGNFDVSSATGAVTFQHAGTWYDYLTGQTFNATGASQNLTMEPGEYHVYLDRNVTNVLTPVTDIVYQGRHVRLQAYPNPVAESANIEYDIPAAGNVSVALFDITGRLVRKIENGFKTAGNYRLVLHRGQLQSGPYLLQLEFKNKKLVQKLLVK